MKARAPVLGGNFGVWGGLFSTYDCTIIAGFFTVRLVYPNPQPRGGSLRKKEKQKANIDG
jgi:hypothetical protein